MTAFRTGRRGFLAGASAAMAVGLAPGVIRPATAQGPTPVTYLTPFGYLISFAETMYADTGGFFAKHGLDVTIQGGRGSAMAVQQVVSQNALVSRTGGTDLIKAYAADPSVVAVGEIFQRDIFYVISAQDAPIETPEDMAGKQIGVVSAGGATENILDMMLAAREVPSDSVGRQVVGNAPAAFELVQLGRIAAFIATSDTVLQLNVDNAPIVAWSTDEHARAPGQVYMTSRAQLDVQKENLAKFMSAVHDCLGAMLQTEDLAPVVASMMTEYEIFEAGRPDQGLAVLRNSLKNYEQPYADKLASQREAWDSAYALMVKAGLIDEIEDRNFYDDSARMLAFS